MDIWVCFVSIMPLPYSPMVMAVQCLFKCVCLRRIILAIRQLGLGTILLLTWNSIMLCYVGVCIWWFETSVPWIGGWKSSKGHGVCRPVWGIWRHVRAPDSRQREDGRYIQSWLSIEQQGSWRNPATSLRPWKGTKKFPCPPAAIHPPSCYPTNTNPEIGWYGSWGWAYAVRTSPWNISISIFQHVSNLLRRHFQFFI